MPEKTIAVLTSGGDAPGMNAGLRAAAELRERGVDFALLEAHEDRLGGRANSFEYNPIPGSPAKLYWERHSLVDFGTGFMRLAMKTGTPIIPAGTPWIQATAL